LRICSFLPSATEIVYLLGLERELFGVTHECDFPEAAKTKPRLTASKLASSQSSSREIDEAVRKSLTSGEGIYDLDYEAMKKADPDLILTQELCEVCAVSYGEIFRAASALPKKAEIVSLDTFTLHDILESVRTVGAKSRRKREAEEIIDSLNNRINYVTELATRVRPSKRRVLFLEWIDPLMSGGHWVPELIMRAGGDDIFGQHGKNARIINWKDIVDYKPEYIIVAPCGFGVERARTEASYLKGLKGWLDLPAVRHDNVFLADGSAYFSRPGPRIVDGLEILSLILNPELAPDYASRYSEKDYSRFQAT
jgi:iron complex transport system substrate-binding protein